MILTTHFLLVALELPPCLEERALTQAEIDFRATVRAKLPSHPAIRLSALFVNGLLLTSREERPLVSLLNACRLHGYKYMSGRGVREYEDMLSFLLQRMPPPPPMDFIPIH